MEMSGQGGSSPDLADSLKPFAFLLVVTLIPFIHQHMPN